MAFKTPITIKEAIKHIHHNTYVLPGIQREFVWNPEQMIRLFDSVMRGYPINSFLFWNVDKAHCREYKFYKFLCEYHERDNRHNPLADSKGAENITAILDGQQRLTSLYIGLKGSYASKAKGKRLTSPDAFSPRKLYLNLLQEASDEDNESFLEYDFQFLTPDNAKNKEGYYWFPVGEILNFPEGEPDKINDYIHANNISDSRHAGRCLFKLYKVICESPLINYYEEEDQKLDKVLNIFTRVNSGGTTLSYSDLLLSVATAQWTKLDAREEINRLVDDLNRTGHQFDLSKDFVLKSCLVLTDIPDIGFKAKNFTQKNTEKIESQWPKISRALRDTVSLVSQFGYEGRTLTANNVLIPVAYYMFAREPHEGYLTQSKFNDDRNLIRKWIMRALLSAGTFGSGLDTTLRAARTTIMENPGAFPSQQLDAAFAKIGRSLRFEEERIDALLDLKYGKNLTFSVLALLYPNIKFDNIFHEDHIFPRSKFNNKNLISAGVPQDQISEFLECGNRIANLQLLEGTLNRGKSDTMPAEWVSKHFQAKDEQANYKRLNYIGDIPESITQFLTFYEDRRQRMKEKLMDILEVVSHGDQGQS